MGCECQGGKNCGLGVGFYGGGVKDTMDAAEIDVFEAEWHAIRLGSGVIPGKRSDEYAIKIM